MDNMYCEVSADVFIIYAIYTEKSSTCRKELHIMVKKNDESRSGKHIVFISFLKNSNNISSMIYNS